MSSPHNLQLGHWVLILLCLWSLPLGGQTAGVEALTYVGSADGFLADRMEVGPDGDVYFFGTENMGDKTAVVARVSADLQSIRYLTRLPGSGRFRVRGLGVTADGAAYVAGSLYGTLETSPDAYQPTSIADDRVGFIARVSAAGIVERASWFPEAEINDLVVDLDGKPVLIGETRSPLFPTTPDAWRPTMRPAACVRSCFAGSLSSAISCRDDPCGDGFLARLSQNLDVLEYATFLGADPIDPTDLDDAARDVIDEGNDRATAVALDPFGHIIVAGSTNATRFPVTPGAWQSTISGYRDLFVMKLSPDGRELLAATLLGEAFDDEDPKLAVDNQGNWALTAMELDPESDRPVSDPGRSDTIVAKLADDGRRLSFRRAVGDGFSMRLQEPQTFTRIATTADNSVLLTSPGPFSTEQHFGCVDSTYVTELDGETGEVRQTFGFPSFGYEVSTAPDGTILVGGRTRGTVALAATTGAAEELPVSGPLSALARLTLEPPSALRVDCLANAAARAVWPRNYGILSMPPFRTDTLVSPGEVLTIWGSGLGPEQAQIGRTKDGLFPSTLGGVRVRVGGSTAALLYAGEGQINLASTFSPETLPAAGLDLFNRKLVERTLVEIEHGEESLSFWVPIEAASPGVFTVNASGVGQAFIVNEDGSWNAPDNPAAPGSVVEIFVTGLGRTAVEETHGIKNAERRSVAPVPGLRVEFGARNAEVLDVLTDVGSVAGVYRVRARVTGLQPRGEQPVTVIVGNSLDSQVLTTISVAE